MPEGDTIHYAANRIRPVLLGRVPDEHRHAASALRAATAGPSGCAAASVEAVEAHGKHLFLRFEGDLTIHSHLRMTGSWRVHPDGARWGRAPRRAWLVITLSGHDVVQFDGPVLELLTETRRALRPPPRARWGPTSSRTTSTSSASCAACARTTRPRPIGDALLDQRTIAGIGNLWKAEAASCAQIDPWRHDRRGQRRGGARDRRGARPRMQRSARDGNQTPVQGDLRQGRARLPPLRRGRIRQRGPVGGQPPDLLVPRMPALTHRTAGASATRAQTTSRRATRRRRFDAALAARRRHGRVRRAARAAPTGPASCSSPTTTRTGQASRDGADARGGPGPPLRRGVRRASSSTSTSSSPATSTA